MRIYAAADYEEMSQRAASILAAHVITKPDAVLGLATGSTPIGTYDRLAAMHQKGMLDFSQVTTVNLDEYEGLSGEHPQSYRYFMNKHLFERINIPREHTFIPDGLAKNSAEECKRYTALLHSLKNIDIQLLGIGSNGHIGFNEPSDSFCRDTHVVMLAEQTRKNNSRFFSSPEEVPARAITMGIGNIMSAESILLLANGKNKSDALFAALFGPITPKVPASILQFHNNVTVAADEEALCAIREFTRWEGKIYDC